MNCVSIYFCFHNKTRTPGFAWVSVTVPTSNLFVKSQNSVQIKQILNYLKCNEPKSLSQGSQVSQISHLFVIEKELRNVVELVNN